VSGTSLDVAGVFDRASADYDHTGVRFFAPLGQELVRRADIATGDRVLDVGCGRGACLFPAAAAAGPTGSVLGLDLAPGMVRATEREAAERGLGNVEVAVADVAAADLEPGHFDVAVSGLVLFFVPDPAQAVARIHAALRPGGTVAFTSFAGRDERWQPVSELLVAAGGTPPQPPGAEAFASDEAVTDLLLAGGFTEVAHDTQDTAAEFLDPDAWQRWARSHFQRALFETIPAERADAALADARALVDRLRDPDGTIRQRYRVRFTTARRPVEDRAVG
jgi:ubiquinone/menaquinone biosynthesis C-methylase UbiE